MISGIEACFVSLVGDGLNGGWAKMTGFDTKILF